MLALAKRSLALLDIPDDGINRTTRLLNWISLAILLISALYACIFAVIIGRPDVIIYGLFAIILSIAVNLAARHGQSRTASLVFVLGIWIVITLSNLSPSADGVYDTAFTAYIIPVLLAGFLLGGRISLAFAVLSLLTGLVLLRQGLSNSSLFIEALPTTQLLHYAAESMFFIIAAILFGLTNRSLSDALKRAYRGEEKLRIHNRDLEREVTERQQIELALRASDQAAIEFQDRLKALHEVSITLADSSGLNDLHRQAIVLGRARLDFDRLGWFKLSDDGQTLYGTYGTDPHGTLSDISDLVVPFSLENWTGNFQRFTSNGHVYYRLDTVLTDRTIPIGHGWNALAAISHGGKIIGWLVADNHLNHRPLQDSQLELLRLYGAILGQIFIQKQTQQLLTEKDERLQLTLNAAQMHIWDWNIVTGEITRLDGDEGIPGMIHSHMSYQDFFSRVHPDDQPLVLNSVRRMVEQTGQYEAEYRVYDQNGAVHWIYSLGRPYHNQDADILGVSGVIQDITGRRAIEETLKRADQQATELMIERERVNALTEFINTVSHDFKTPLAIINNSLYLLQRINDPVKQKDKLELIKAQTLLLDKQIQDILTISRLEYSQQVIAHPVNVNTLWTKIADLFRPSFENKNQTLHLDLQDDLPVVIADTEELDRAFVNLVENAINYTPQGGEITIRTRLVEGSVECAVSDTGIGMSEADTHQIFNNFYRAENARMVNSKGTGLGLAIVKRIVTHHNGSIAVESQLGKGTTFRLRFPVMVRA